MAWLRKWGFGHNVQRQRIQELSAKRLRAFVDGGYTIEVLYTETDLTVGAKEFLFAAQEVDKALVITTKQMMNKSLHYLAGPAEIVYQKVADFSYENLIQARAPDNLPEIKSEIEFEHWFVRGKTLPFFWKFPKNEAGLIEYIKEEKHIEQVLEIAKHNKWLSAETYERLNAISHIDQL